MNDKKRTNQQNKALHLWFKQLSDTLNNDGFDMRAVISPGIDILWSPYTVKEHLFRPVMKAYLDKKSTTELTTDEIDKIFDMVNKAIGERTGIHIKFPSIETLMEEDNII